MMLFILAASMPFLKLDLGVGETTKLIGGPVALQQDGLWEVAFVVLATTMLAPVTKLGAMIWVLIGLRLKNPPKHLVEVFRWVEFLSPWSMVEVFMLGVFVAYSRLNALAPVHLGIGLYSFGALMMVMCATDSVMDHEAIWQRLESRTQTRTDISMARLSWTGPSRPGRLIACDTCGEVAQRPGPCPRCGVELRHRKPESLARSLALLMAAAVLYIPANTLPVLTVVRLGQGQPSTILEGVRELANAGEWPLAVLVFVASIAVPVLKILGLAVLLFTTWRRTNGRLMQRNWLYKVVEAVGRWSMIDVFMISILSALVRAGTLASVMPGPGVLCFCSVVILTMLAANTFDPRLMWDAAEPDVREQDRASV